MHYFEIPKPSDIGLTVVIPIRCDYYVGTEDLSLARLRVLFFSTHELFLTLRLDFLPITGIYILEDFCASQGSSSRTSAVTRGDCCLH